MPQEHALDRRHAPAEGPIAPGRAVTSFDVAAAAGVSQSTVSRALREVDGVSRETIERVRAAAERLGYLPDHRAANLRTAVTGCVALVVLVPEGATRGALNPFYYDLVGAVESAAARRGLRVMLSFQQTESGLRCDFEQRREADGAIVIGSAAADPAWRFFAAAAAAGRRVIAWGAPDDRLPVVRADNEGGARLAVEHLVAGGRRRIAFVGPGWERQHAYAERRAGFLAALGAHRRIGIDVPVPGGADREDQGAAAVAWMQAHAPDVDGVFAASDLIAIGIVRALERAGRRVPHDVAVIGFDGIQSARHASPRLTTIEQDVTAAGERMVDALLGAGGAVPRVPVRLVVRESA